MNFRLLGMTMTLLLYERTGIVYYIRPILLKTSAKLISTQISNKKNILWWKLIILCYWNVIKWMNTLSCIDIFAWKKVFSSRNYEKITIFLLMDWTEWSWLWQEWIFFSYDECAPAMKLVGDVIVRFSD